MKYISLLFILLISILAFSYYYYNHLFFIVSLKEGFQNDEKWSKDLLQRFNTYQLTVNQNVNQFNMDILQQQATPEEAEEYLKTGYWYWPEDLKKLYLEKVESNPIIRIEPQYALDYAMKVYNQTAALQLLAWNSKEGEFLLYGIKLENGDEIKCSNSNDGKIEKYDKHLGQITFIKPEELTKEIPGFSFVDKVCNPCVNMDNGILNADKCAFKLNVNGDDKISLPWNKIWGM